MDWPSQSPDLNIIEEVWNFIKHKLKGRTFDDEDQLWEEVKYYWENFEHERLKKLYESLPRRIEALRQAKGMHTKY